MNSIAQTVARRARAAVGFVVWSDRNGLHEAMTSASTQPQASVGTLVFLRGLIVSVLGERSHVIVADVDASNLPASIQATSRSWGARSLAIVPLPGSEAGSGGVGILDPLPRDYEPAVLATLSACALEVQSAIDEAAASSPDDPEPRRIAETMCEDLRQLAPLIRLQERVREGTASPETLAWTLRRLSGAADAYERLSRQLEAMRRSSHDPLLEPGPERPNGPDARKPQGPASDPITLDALGGPARDHELANASCEGEGGRRIEGSAQRKP